MTVPLLSQPLGVGSGDSALELILRRVDGPKRSCSSAPVAVLLHGGNTNGAAFCYPEGGLAWYLAQRFDVWLVEWRASPDIVEPLLDGKRILGGSVAAERRMFTLDTVADVDLPAALSAIRSEVGARPLSLLAHCLSGAAVSMALARGTLEPFELHSVSLMTLGLFCEVPWNGWLKAESFFLERIISEEPERRGICPRQLGRWPLAMSAAYAEWPRAWLPRDGGFLDQLSFLIGQPFALDRLHPELHKVGVERFFGQLHLGIYMHAAQIVRRGYAAPFDSADLIDRTRIRQSKAGAVAAALSDLCVERFAKQRLTLFVAPQNQVWHRDSMDLMYDWLRNGGCRRVAKEVVPGANLQELLWGKQAIREVYPRIARSLNPA